MAATMLGFRDHGQGIPLLLLHAFPLHAGMWQPQLDALSVHARVLAVDAPGRGRSAAMPPTPDLDARADQLRMLLDTQGIAQAVVVGLSMGGYTAFTLYRRFPERVRGLVLADTRAQADTEDGRAGRMAMIRTAEAEGAAAIADLMIPKLVGHTTARETQPDVLSRVRQMIESVPVPAIVADLRAMAARVDSTDLLSAIAVPTLVLVGDEDVPTPLADAREMADRIPGAHLAVISHAGHLSNLEQPEAFNQALKDFLDELREVD